jgi:hypothetical protein
MADYSPLPHQKTRIGLDLRNRLIQRHKATANPVPRTYVRGFGHCPYRGFRTFVPALTYEAFCATG